MKYALIDSYGENITVGTIEEINDYWSDFSEDHGGDETLTDSKLLRLEDEPVSFELEEDNIIIDSDENNFILLDADECYVFSGNISQVKDFYQKWYENYGQDYDFTAESIYALTDSISFSANNGIILID